MYGLEGVEAGMLMEPGWSVGTGMKLMMHAEKTWSGPGGWMKIAKGIWYMNRGRGQLKLPPALWVILGLPSMFVFTAYPVSGLCLEMTQGFLHGNNVGGGPMVKGFTYVNFNERSVSDAMNGAAITWANALDARVMGHGAVYTPKGYDRSRDAFLNKLPTVLPKEDGITRMFLSAQADNPIEGNTWGLLVQYNCSIVDSLKDLRVLSTRNTSAYILGSNGGTKYTTNNGSMQIMVRNQTDSKWAYNMNGVMEIGYELWPNMTTWQRGMAEDPNFTFTKEMACYFNEAENVTGDYPGIEQERIFEVLLWQSLLNTQIGDLSSRPQINFSLSHNITDAYGAYDLNKFPLDDLPRSNGTNLTKTQPPQLMSAIGVQCKASSNVGTADIDGVTSTYSNFMRTDTPILNQTRRCAQRFGAEVPSWLIPDFGGEWLASLFSSTAAPPPFYLTYSDDPTNIDSASGLNIQLNYLQAEQLRQSMLRAYAAYAVQLMYNGGQGFTTREGSQISFQNPNVTEFVLGTVITRGVVPAELPIVLFVAWALVGSVLGIMYGFRRRWSAILDGYTMFRLGADLPVDVKRRFADHSNTLEVENCHGLNKVPGLVGDTKPEMCLGRIGLVQSSVASKGKMYE
jgi:hypothetical protein